MASKLKSASTRALLEIVSYQANAEDEEDEFREAVEEIQDSLEKLKNIDGLHFTQLNDLSDKVFELGTSIIALKKKDAANSDLLAEKIEELEELEDPFNDAIEESLKTQNDKEVFMLKSAGIRALLEVISFHPESQDTDEEDEFEEAAAEIQESLEALKKLANPHFNQLNELSGKIIATGKSILRLKKNAGVDTKLLAEKFNKLEELEEPFDEAIKDTLATQTQKVVADVKEINNGMGKMLTLNWSVMLGGILLASLLAYVIANSISAPIEALKDKMLSLAGGNANLTITNQNGDEVVILTQVFNKLIANLRFQNSEVAEAAAVLASSGAEISAYVTQVAAGSSETAAAVTETTATVEEVKQTSQVSSEKAKAVSENTNQAWQFSQEGKQASSEALDGMTHIRRQMGAIADSIGKLSEQSQAIGEIIAAVDDIAGQSNLLAVNASIEAAKAGEHGLGFAVVAQEIKSLAGQSKQATEQVRSLLGDIQKASHAAVTSTQQGENAVETGIKQTAKTGESIDQLYESIKDGSQAAIQIAASSQQQLAGMDQVAMAMESIKQASNQNVESMDQLKGSAENLQELGQKLKAMVEQFKI
jgi:methyl-accepting chemotaxis protein